MRNDSKGIRTNLRVQQPNDVQKDNAKTVGLRIELDDNIQQQAVGFFPGQWSFEDSELMAEQEKGVSLWRGLYRVRRILVRVVLN